MEEEVPDVPEVPAVPAVPEVFGGGGVGSAGNGDAGISLVASANVGLVILSISNLIVSINT